MSGRPSSDSSGIPGPRTWCLCSPTRGGTAGRDLGPSRPLHNEAEHRDLYHGGPYPPAPTILKHGPGGAEFLGDGIRHRIPAPPADEADPIGAGEILAGSFLALRARGLPEDLALTYAVAAATRSVTEFGVPGPAVTGELKRVRAELEHAT